MSCHYWWYCHNMDLYLQIDQAGVPAVTLRFQRLIPINADAHCYSVIKLAISAAPSMCGITDIIMKMCVFVSCWIITFGFFFSWTKQRFSRNMCDGKCFLWTTCHLNQVRFLNPKLNLHMPCTLLTIIFLCSLKSNALPA